jgi:hypothetical protein
VPGLVNGGMVNSGHALVNGGVIRAASPFDPDTVSGLVIWHKPETLTGYADTAEITSWTDSSGTANTATNGGFAGRGPVCKTNILNGYRIARFNGTSNYLVQPGYTPSTTMSIFLVVSFDTSSERIIWSTAKVVTPPSGGILVGGRAASTANNLFVQSGLGGTWCDGANNTAGGALGAGFNVIEVVVAAGSTNAWLNRTNTISDGTHGTMGAATSTTVAIGVLLNELGAALADFHKGDLAEILIYDNAVSTADRAHIENYLYTKYAL